jgi:hypothetical protein
MSCIDPSGETHFRARVVASGSVVPLAAGDDVEVYKLRINGGMLAYGLSVLEAAADVSDQYVVSRSTTGRKRRVSQVGASGDGARGVPPEVRNLDASPDDVVVTTRGSLAWIASGYDAPGRRHRIVMKADASGVALLAHEGPLGHGMTFTIGKRLSLAGTTVAWRSYGRPMSAVITDRPARPG